MKRRLHNETSSESEDEMIMFSSSGSDDEELAELKEGVTYVIVLYESSYFPGLVKKVFKTGVTVSCMRKSGPKSWKWPDHEDICAYTMKNIIRIIKTPTTGSRGQCSVPEADKYWC